MCIQYICTTYLPDCIHVIGKIMAAQWIAKIIVIAQKYRDLEAAPHFTSSVDITINLKVESNTAPLWETSGGRATNHTSPTFPQLTLQYTCWQSPQARDRVPSPDAHLILVLHNTHHLYPSTSWENTGWELDSQCRGARQGVFTCHPPNRLEQGHQSLCRKRLCSNTALQRHNRDSKEQVKCTSNKSNSSRFTILCIQTFMWNNFNALTQLVLTKSFFWHTDIALPPILLSFLQYYHYQKSFNFNFMAWLGWV